MEMAKTINTELKKQLQEVQQEIRELPLDSNGNPKDMEYANKLSDKELDLITKVYGDA